MADNDLQGNPVRELLRRFLVTLLLGVVVYRLGTYVTVPGLELSRMREFFGDASEGDLGGVLAMANMFNGGAIANGSLFGLGIMPYISASIIFQLLAHSIPSLKQLQKEGESGKRKINQYTRYATVGICFIQGLIASWALSKAEAPGGASLVDPDFNQIAFVLSATLTVTTGSMALLWIAEQITRRGIGNGVSVVIMIGILAQFPAAVTSIKGDLAKYLLILAFLLAIIAGIVVVVQATRRINLEQQRRVQGNRMYGGGQTALPMKINQAGVIPVIFGQPVITVLGFLLGGLGSMVGLATMGQLLAFDTPLYRYVFAALIIGFTYFYISLTFDLNEMANHFKQAGFFIRGVKPGKKTVDYLRYHLMRITFVGATFLAVISIVPQMFGSEVLGLETNASYALLGGTGLLIVVGVSLDVIQKVASFFLAHQYQGLGGQGMSGKKSGKRF